MKKLCQNRRLASNWDLAFKISFTVIQRNCSSGSVTIIINNGATFKKTLSFHNNSHIRKLLPTNLGTYSNSRKHIYYCCSVCKHVWTCLCVNRGLQYLIFCGRNTTQSASHQSYLIIRSDSCVAALRTSVGVYRFFLTVNNTTLNVTHSLDKIQMNAEC